ncbi:MAG TPA: hypothetical protein VMV94_05105 [Phycisphaerae bacterium]|nr:hypothetical protein [Phycisphaerae bacterium]
MHAAVRPCQLCLALLLFSSVACQSPTTEAPAPKAPANPELPAAPATQPATEAASPTSGPVSLAVEPGIYKFKARVDSIGELEEGLRHKMLDGAGVVRGERCIFTGEDLTWRIRLEVQEVYDPLSFLQPGAKLAFLVHNVDQVLGPGNDDAAGRAFDFSLTIRSSPGGRLHYGPLTTPTGLFAEQGGFGPRQ